MNILITGGTGFIGSNLVSTCLEAGDDVKVLAQANTPAEQDNLAELQARGVDLQLGSVTDAEVVKDAMAGVDVVYHLAAAQHEAGKPDSHFRNVNVEGTRTMLNAAVSAGVRRFVHGSTIGVYEAREHRTVRDDSPLQPDNIYGVTKLEAERLIETYRDRLSIVVIRISETYGPVDRRLLKLFKAVGQGKYFHIGKAENKHHPVYIDDLIAALRLGATADHATADPMVAPGYEVVTSREMANTIARVLRVPEPKRTVPLVPLWWMGILMEMTLRPLGINPPLHRRRLHFYTKGFAFEGKAAKDGLGYQPTVSFEEGIRRTAEWYREHGLLDTLVPASDQAVKASA